MKRFYALFFLIIPFFSHAQEKFFDKTSVYFGGNLAENFFGDVGIFYGKYGENRWGGLPMEGKFVYAGSEFNFKRDFIYAPKVGVSAYVLFLSAKLDALYYIAGKDQTFALRPQIGLSLNFEEILNFDVGGVLSDVDFMYGRNFLFNNHLLGRVNTHCFTFYLKIPTKQRRY